MNATAVSDETLMALADGVLAREQAGAVAEAVAADPALARRLAALAQGGRAARDAFADVAHEPVPDSLLAAVLAADARTNQPSLPRPANTPRQWRAVAAAAAVALMVGGGLGLLLGRAGGPGGGTAGLLPLAAIAPALETALAQARSGETLAGNGGARIALLSSHRIDNGTFCRSFTVTAARELNGLACNEAGGWRLVTLVAEPVGASGAGLYRPAGGGATVVQDMLDRLDAGPPLDEGTEDAARARGWRAP